MDGICKNPEKTITIPNTRIEDSKKIFDRITNKGSHKVVSIDDTMAKSNIWIVVYEAKNVGFYQSGLKATFSFKEQNGCLELTIECGKNIGAISDQWELEECNTFINNVMKVAINEEIDLSEEQTGNDWWWIFVATISFGLLWWIFF